MTMTTKALAAQAARPQERLAFDPDNLPLRICNWGILVAPVTPRTHSDGGIELPEDAKKAEGYLISIGKVMAIGGLAQKSVTPGGLRLAEDPNNPKVGEYVLFDQYAGTRIQFRDGRVLIILTDTEIKAVLEPEVVPQVQFYL
jgi:co-chaperonin GroES (HSP10)